MSERGGADPDEIDEADEVEAIEEELSAHPDAPEADVIEQHQSVVVSSPPDLHLRPDIPEADALEQALPVDEDDEFFDE